jgi:O-antigen/teichoic acid export membrane protein
VTMGGVAFAYLLPLIIEIPRSQLTRVIVMAVLVGAATGLAVATSALPGAARGLRSFRTASLAATAGVGCQLLLLVVLLGHLGVVALGVAAIGGVTVERIVLAMWVRKHLPWFRLRPSRFDRAAVWRTAGVALPLLVLAIDTQVVAASDAVVVGAVVGAAAIAIYRVGSIAPSQAIQALFRGGDVVFPSLVDQDEAEQITMVRFLTRLWSYLAGVGFTLLVLFRREAVVALLGHHNSTAELVLVLFSITFAVDAIPHSMVLLLVARGRQRILVGLAPVEIVVNLSLTILFVERWGASGAAWAAIVSYPLLDLVFFPLVARKEFTPSVVILLGEGLGALIVGSITCVVATSVPVLTMVPSFTRAALGIAAGCVGGLGVGLAALGPTGRDDLRRMFRRQVPSDTG